MYDVDVGFVNRVDVALPGVDSHGNCPVYASHGYPKQEVKLQGNSKPHKN